MKRPMSFRRYSREIPCCAGRKKGYYLSVHNAAFFKYNQNCHEASINMVVSWIGFVQFLAFEYSVEHSNHFANQVFRQGNHNNDA